MSEDGLDGCAGAELTLAIVVEHHANVPLPSRTHAQYGCPCIPEPRRTRRIFGSPLLVELGGEPSVREQAGTWAIGTLVCACVVEVSTSGGRRAEGKE